MKRVRNERGIALAVAIFALVVIGTLVAGSFFVGLQEQRVGQNTVKFQQAFSAAQEGAQLQVANWSGGTHANLPVGGSAQFAGKVGDNTGWYRGNVRKLNDQLFIVDSEGFSRDNGTRQRVGLLVRIKPIEINIQAGLTTQGVTKIGGSSYINGQDTPPTGWACPATEPMKPGILIDDPAKVTTSGCDNYSCVNGDPKVKKDTTITAETLTTFGDLKFADLKGIANKIIPGGNIKVEPTLVAGGCNRNSLTNWGDPKNPSAPCHTYFPIIYSTASLSVNGVQGQGVLIVDGDLSVQGGFEFYGPVIVKGTVKTTGTGGHFNGGVMAANVDLGQNTVLGNAVVNYSSCALIKALSATAPGALLSERSWVSMY